MRCIPGSAAVYRLLRSKISSAKGTLKRNRKSHSWMDIFFCAPKYSPQPDVWKDGWNEFREGSVKEIRIQQSGVRMAAGPLC
jgi:hypothetical protein